MAVISLPWDHASWLHKELSKEWTITVRGILAPPDVAGCDHEVIVLNRFLASVECDEKLIRDTPSWSYQRAG